MSSGDSDGKSEVADPRATADILLGLCGTSHGYGRVATPGDTSVHPERRLQLGDDAAFPDWHVHGTMFPPNLEDASKTFVWATNGMRSAPLIDMIDTVPSLWRSWAEQQIRLTMLCDYWDGSRRAEVSIQSLFFDKSGPLIGLRPVLFAGGRLVVRLDESANALYAYVEFSPTHGYWPSDSMFARRPDEMSDALLDMRVVMSRWTIFTCVCLSLNKESFDFQEEDGDGEMAVTTARRFWWPVDGKETETVRSSASPGSMEATHRIIRDGVSASMSLSPVEYVQTRAVPAPGMVGSASAHSAGNSEAITRPPENADSNIATIRRCFGSLR